MSAVNTDHLQSTQDRPMVIQQACRIPEVRIFPPDSTEENVSDGHFDDIGNVQHRYRHRTFENMINMGTRLLPYAPQSDDPSWGNWQPFHMRPVNLMTFTSCQSAYRNSGRAHNVAIQRARSGWVSSAAKSLDLVRQNIQQSINREISEVIKQYTDKFFAPAIENIKRNIGENSVSDEHIQAVCRQILEDAKRMYTGGFGKAGTPFGDNSDSETGSHGESRTINCRQPAKRKRKESGSDSENSLHTIQLPVKKKGRPPLNHSNHSGRVTPSKQGKGSDVIKKEGPRWDPNRVTEDTYFIMGAKANKALGFGATRGRLYTKHPEVFKYCGDSEDKQWLYENNRMPATGGKAYMLILDDIKELVESDEYRNSPGLVLDALNGFKVPKYMQDKIRLSMNAQRTDIQQKKIRGRPPNSIADNAAQGTNIPQQQSFSNKTDGSVTEEAGKEEEPVKSSHFELAESTLLYDEADDSDRTPQPMSYAINEVDSSSDIQENTDADSQLTTSFDITNPS